MNDVERKEGLPLAKNLKEQIVTGVTDRVFNCIKGQNPTLVIDRACLGISDQSHFRIRHQVLGPTQDQVADYIQGVPNG